MSEIQRPGTPIVKGAIMPPTYADVEIQILAARDKGYPVRIMHGGQRFPQGVLRREVLPWVSGASPEEDGERLWTWLFEDEPLKLAWAELRGQESQRRVRLHIDDDTPPCRRHAPSATPGACGRPCKESWRYLKRAAALPSSRLSGGRKSAAG
jgi:hypothetical protein